MVSVVMPAYNEARHLASAVRIVHEALTSRRHDFELIVVENGSDDDTREILERLALELGCVRALFLPAADYGLALRKGIAAANGERLVIFGVDHIDLGFMDAALARLASAAPPHVVLGSKRGPGAIDHRPRFRQLITASFSGAVNLLFGLGVPDTHGIKAMDRRSLAPVAAACRSNHDLFDSELVLRAARADMRIESLPIEISELRPPRSGVLGRVPRTLVGLVRLRWTLWSEAR